MNMKQARSLYRKNYKSKGGDLSFREWTRLMVVQRSVSFQNPVGKLKALTSSR